MNITASVADLESWVGKPYTDGQCWDPFIRDAFREIRGVELPESYYEASIKTFDTVWSERRQRKDFVPQPWDVVMLRTHEFLVLHCAIVLDSDRFIQPWQEAGGLVICSISDWQKRIAGYLRLKADTA